MYKNKYSNCWKEPSTSQDTLARKAKLASNKGDHILVLKKEDAGGRMATWG